MGNKYVVEVLEELSKELEELSTSINKYKLEFEEHTSSISGQTLYHIKITNHVNGRCYVIMERRWIAIWKASKDIAIKIVKEYIKKNESVKRMKEGDIANRSEAS